MFYLKPYSNFFLRFSYFLVRIKLSHIFVCYFLSVFLYKFLHTLKKLYFEGKHYTKSWFPKFWFSWWKFYESLKLFIYYRNMERNVFGARVWNIKSVSRIVNILSILSIWIFETKRWKLRVNKKTIHVERVLNKFTYTTTMSQLCLSILFFLKIIDF